MNTPLVSTLQDLLKTGEKLIPQGGSESSGYNAKRQSKYLQWRKNCLDAIGLLREKGTVLFSRIANDENGMYFYHSSAQKISTVVTEALQIALAIPAPAPEPALPVQADAPAVPEPTAETPVPPLPEPTAETPALQPAEEDSPVPDPWHTIEPPINLTGIEVAAEAVEPLLAPEAVDPGVAAEAIDPGVAPEAEPVVAPEAEPNPLPAAAAHDYGNDGFVETDAAPTDTAGMDAVRYSADEVTVDTGTVPKTEKKPAAPTPVVILSLSAHPMLERLHQLFRELSLGAILYTNDAGKWEQLPAFDEMRPLPRYAVLLLSEEHRTEELMALGYLAGKYPWLTLTCIHHHTLSLPALLPGISHTAYADSLDELRPGLVEALITAGYSVSL